MCKQIYSFDPFASLDDSQRSLVLGGEALIWTEQAGPENLDSIAWSARAEPRSRTSVYTATDLIFTLSLWQAARRCRRRGLVDR